MKSYLEKRGDTYVRVDKSGGCAPATAFEVELFMLNRELSAQLNQDALIMESWAVEAQYSSEFNQDQMGGIASKLMAAAENARAAAKKVE